MFLKIKPDIIPPDKLFEMQYFILDAVLFSSGSLKK